MPERATVFEAMQIGLEVTPGTAVGANAKMEAWTVTPQPQGTITPFRPEGFKMATLATVGKDAVEAGITGVLDYANIVYLLSSLVSYAAPVQQGATTAYLWTFVPDTDGPDTVKTYTVEKGSSVRAYEFPFGSVQSLSFAFAGADSQIPLSGNMLGQEITDAITMTAAPTTIAAVPVHPKQCAVKLASTQAGLAGATALTRLLNLEWRYNGKFNPFYTISAEPSWTGTVEAPAEIGATLTLGADSTGMGFLTQARAGTEYWCEIKFVGAVIDGAYSYTLQIQFPFVFANFGEISDADGLVAVRWTLSNVHDDTWTKGLDIQVTNALTELLAAP